MEKIITFSPTILGLLFFLAFRKHSIKHVSYSIFFIGLFILVLYKYMQPVHAHADFGLLNLVFILFYIGGPNLLVFSIAVMGMYIFTKDETDNNQDGGIT